MNKKKNIQERALGSVPLQVFAPTDQSLKLKEEERNTVLLSQLNFSDTLRMKNFEMYQHWFIENDNSGGGDDEEEGEVVLHFGNVVWPCIVESPLNFMMVICIMIVVQVGKTCIEKVAHLLKRLLAPDMNSCYSNHFFVMMVYFFDILHGSSLCKQMMNDLQRWGGHFVAPWEVNNLAVVNQTRTSSHGLSSSSP